MLKTVEAWRGGVIYGRFVWSYKPSWQYGHLENCDVHGLSMVTQGYVMKGDLFDILLECHSLSKSHAYPIYHIRHSKPIGYLFATLLKIQHALSRTAGTDFVQLFNSFNSYLKNYLMCYAQFISGRKKYFGKTVIKLS